jgi:selenocysteine lyase/cysteine desulfurase
MSDLAVRVDSELIHRVRNLEFPWTAQTVYMNSAAIGPLPERTRRYLDDFNYRRAAPHRLDPDELMVQLQETRETVARFINAVPEEIGLTFNTTFGLNVAARALPLEPGDTVIVSDREFPANVYPWLELRGRGVNVELVPTAPSGWPDEDRIVERVQDARVRVLAVSLVQFSNGFKADLGRLGAACHSAGCYLVVDGIQGIGQVPFDVRTTPVDVLACGAQKWLLSPWGSGFVYVRRELLNRLEPPVVGWMAFEGTEDVSHLTDYTGELRSDARRFEVNTLPFQDLIAMSHSLDLLLELGVGAIADWLREVRRPLLEAARDHGFDILSPLDGVHESAIVCVATPRTEVSWKRLSAKGVVCSLREGAIRIAPHFFNTPEEMRQIASILGSRA